MKKNTFFCNITNIIFYTFEKKSTFSDIFLFSFYMSSLNAQASDHGYKPQTIQTIVNRFSPLFLFEKSVPNWLENIVYKKTTFLLINENPMNLLQCKLVGSDQNILLIGHVTVHTFQLTCQLHTKHMARPSTPKGKGYCAYLSWLFSRVYGLGKSYLRVACRRVLKSLQGH